MKKIILNIVAILVAYYSFAQNTLEVTDSGNITRERWRDSMLRMDMNQVPTGFLLEYSMFGFESNKYDGVNNDDDTLKDDGRIFELHSILWHSKVNSNAAIDVTDNLFEKAFSDNRSSNVIPLIFIYQNYNRIRQSALSEGLFTIDADDVGILDVPGRPSSPYDPYEVICLCTFQNRNYTVQCYSVYPA